MARNEAAQEKRKTRKRISAAEIHKQPVIRFQVEMLESRLHRFGVMMTKAGLRTKRELFDNAFAIFDWAIEATSAGKTVGCLTPNGTFESLMTPSLTSVKDYEETKSRQSLNGKHEATPVEGDTGKQKGGKE